MRYCKNKFCVYCTITVEFPILPCTLIECRSFG